MPIKSTGRRFPRPRVSKRSLRRRLDRLRHCPLIGRVGTIAVGALIAAGLWMIDWRMGMAIIAALLAGCGLWWLASRRGTRNGAARTVELRPVSHAPTTDRLGKASLDNTQRVFLHDLRGTSDIPPIELRGETVTLGRARGKTAVVTDRKTRRQCAHFVRHPQTRRWWVTALSGAPITVDGHRLYAGQPPFEIHDGAVLIVGASVYRVTYVGEQHFPPTIPVGEVHTERAAPAVRQNLPRTLGRPIPEPAGDESPTQAMVPAAAPLKLQAAGETSAGDRRHNNDVFLIRGHTSAIADAAGGGEDGVLTARTVRATLRTLLPTSPIDDVFAAADQALRGLRGHSVLAAPSTLDVLTLDTSTFTVSGGHVGDSQVFRTHTDTADDTVHVTAMTPALHQHAALDNAIGFFSDAPAGYTYKLSRWHQPAVANDRYIMVTDGFLNAWSGPHTQTDTAPDQDPEDAIREVLGSQPPDASPARLAEALVRAALTEHKRHGTIADNITVVVAHLTSNAEPEYGGSR